MQREAVVAELQARREAPQRVRVERSEQHSAHSDVAAVSITSVVQNKDYTAYIMRCTARAGPEIWQVRGSARSRRARASRPAAFWGGPEPVRPTPAGLEALQ